MLGVADKLEILRSIRPMLVDVTLRENAVGAPVGQTLPDKIEFFTRLREFGFTDLIVGCLDYWMPDEPQVDDDFMAYLRDQEIDRTGCFALTDVGCMTGTSFVPSQSMQKLREYGIPNTFLEIHLTDEGNQGQFHLESLHANLVASIQWLRASNKGPRGKEPRIVVNIVDGCDAFAEDLERTCDVFAFLATLPIEAVSIEEERGTHFPFQVGAFIKIARSFLADEQKLLIHAHAGAGFENAVVIEALLNGADGCGVGCRRERRSTATPASAS